jgi:hypothetical protein
MVLYLSSSLPTCNVIEHSPEPSVISSVVGRRSPETDTLAMVRLTICGTLSIPTPKIEQSSLTLVKVNASILSVVRGTEIEARSTAGVQEAPGLQTVHAL